ncbi:MAG: hypothetical protein GY831_23600, partial [Delftia sp.]|nr:hypothetical protein [Delftia sp.]
SAVWLREPLLLTPAVGLCAVPYAIALDWIPWITPSGYGLALWPGIAAALMAAHLLDYYLDPMPTFPWDQPEHWFPKAAHRLTNWWALPLHISGYVGALTAAVLSLGYPVPLTLTLALAAAIYGLATVRFRLRGWLLMAVGAGQAAALAAIWAISRSDLLPKAVVEMLSYPAWRAFAFLPVTIATAAAGLWVDQ